MLSMFHVKLGKQYFQSYNVISSINAEAECQYHASVVLSSLMVLSET